jgi:YidC/Oxa1 family membrane protein insertase
LASAFLQAYSLLFSIRKTSPGGIFFSYGCKNDIPTVNKMQFFFHRRVRSSQMNNEKRIFLFLFLALAIFLLSQRFSPLSPPEKTQRQQTESVEKHNPLSGNELDRKEVAPDTPKTEAFRVGEYILHIAFRGGYIKALELKEYPGEELVYKDIFFIPSLRNINFTVNHSPRGLELFNEENGVYIRISSDSKEPYLLDIEVKAESLALDRIKVFSQTEDKGTRFASRYQEVFYGTEQLTRVSFSGLKKQKTLSSPLSLVGARDKHFSLVLISPSQARYFLDKQEKEVVLTAEVEDDTVYIRERIFLGPQKSSILQRYGLQNIVDFGFFHFFAVIIARALFFLNSLFRNWGLSIIALSTLIYFILFPLTAKSTKSMRKMQEQMKYIQPKVNEIKEKYKDKPQKMNKEIMDLYKKNQVNPLGSLGGCLPMLLQIPIFIALYQVLNRLVEIKGANFLWIKDLSQPDYLVRLPFSLPLLGDGIHLLPLIMVGIMVLQQKYATPQVQSSEQQKMMGVLFPVIFGFVFYSFPAGLVLYWLCNSTFTFLYQLKLTQTKTA